MAMRRIINVTALALVLVGASLTTASAATPYGSSPDSPTTTIHFIARTIDSAQLDLGAKGLSLGDQAVFTDNLLQDGKRVGEGHGVCTITRITGTAPSRTLTNECLITGRLPRGQITIQGLLPTTEQGMSPPHALAVNGGTGAYRTAHGEVHVRQISNTENDITIRLILCTGMTGPNQGGSPT
jgi:hypothetical protein